MLEDELDRVTGLLRIQTHADVAGHRDRKIGKKPVRGIAAGNGDSRTWRQVEFAQRRGHAPHLGFAFGERVFLPGIVGRSEEHTSELQSLMRISYAVFCLKKKNM